MWHIDRDYITAGLDMPTRVGVQEGHDRIPVMAALAGFESSELPTHDEHGVELPTVRFRLLDDDGEVYYGGYLHDDGECLNQLAALRYGEADAGCTTIEVKRNDAWVQEIG